MTVTIKQLRSSVSKSATLHHKLAKQAKLSQLIPLDPYLLAVAHCHSDHLSTCTEFAAGLFL